MNEAAGRTRSEPGRIIRETILAVRTGRLGRRLLLVPAVEAAYIVPRAERIWLRTPVTIIGSEQG